MQKGICVALVAVVLLCVVGWSRGQSTVPGTVPGTVAEYKAAVGGSGSAGGLITHRFPGGPTGDHLVVIDSQARVMAVYRVQRERGEIALESVRRIDADLKLLSYNTDRPLPEEIEAGLKRQE